MREISAVAPMSRFLVARRDVERSTACWSPRKELLAYVKSWDRVLMGLE
jgi:hypothetical protein